MMSRRGFLAVLQLTVFVGGGVVVPVAHLARHRPDHTHGPGGWVSALDTGSSPESDHGHPAAALSSTGQAAPPRPRRGEPHEARAHLHPHVRSHQHGHDDHGHEPVETHGLAAHTPSEKAGTAGHDLDANPLERAHGHGSLAHLGLALLSAPPPLPLPAPRLAGVLAHGRAAQGVALFHPGFPRPRPPPVLASS